jgi:hypothetical protein
VPQYFVLVGGGCTDEGPAHFGTVVSKVPVHRLTDAVDRLLDLYRAQRNGDENLGAFFRRIPPAVATEALRDLAQAAAQRSHRSGISIDLGETQVFAPEVMGRRCSARTKPRTSLRDDHERAKRFVCLLELRVCREAFVVLAVLLLRRPCRAPPTNRSGTPFVSGI